MKKKEPVTEPQFVDIIDPSTGEVLKCPVGGSVFINGVEFPDPTPVALALKFKKPLSIQEQMMQMIRADDFRKALLNRDVETFEEADDFDVDDDSFDPTTPYEQDFDNATIAAAQAGAVQPPADTPELRSLGERVKKHLRRGRFAQEEPNHPPATPPAKQNAEPSGAPKTSGGAAPTPRPTEGAQHSTQT